MAARVRHDSDVRRFSASCTRWSFGPCPSPTPIASSPSARTGAASVARPPSQAVTSRTGGDTPSRLKPSDTPLGQLQPLGRRRFGARRGRPSDIDLVRRVPGRPAAGPDIHAVRRRSGAGRRRRSQPPAVDAALRCRSRDPRPADSSEQRRAYRHRRDAGSLRGHCRRPGTVGTDRLHAAAAHQSRQPRPGGNSGGSRAVCRSRRRTRNCKRFTNR